MLMAAALVSTGVPAVALHIQTEHFSNTIDKARPTNHNLKLQLEVEQR